MHVALHLRRLFLYIFAFCEQQPNAALGAEKGCAGLYSTDLRVMSIWSESPTPSSRVVHVASHEPRKGRDAQLAASYC